MATARRPNKRQRQIALFEMKEKMMPRHRQWPFTKTQTMWFDGDLFSAWPISITTYRRLLGPKITIESIFDQCGRFAVRPAALFFLSFVQNVAFYVRHSSASHKCLHLCSHWHCSAFLWGSTLVSLFHIHFVFSALFLFQFIQSNQSNHSSNT